MKFKLKSFLALLMLVCLVLTAAGCKGKTEEEPAKEKVNEDFFTESLISDESQSEQAGTNGDASDSGSSNASSDVDQMVHEDNRINGKSWNDVLASMPKNLRGTNLTVYNWNAANEYTGAPEVITQFTKQTGMSPRDYKKHR